MVTNKDFLEKLYDCVACITEASSVAMIPALIGMPLLYANYGELQHLRFGSVLTSYPRGYMLKNISNISCMLNVCHEDYDTKAINNWISLNSGPLPAGDMPCRVADIVGMMIGLKLEVFKTGECNHDYDRSLKELL